MTTERATIGLRLPDIQQFGWSLLATRIIAQFIGYLAFGALGGWAAGIVGAGITKLDRFDVTDDASELLNARGLHQQLGQEIARAQRYDSDYAVVTVTFALTENKREIRQKIGDVVRESVRSVDDTGRITLDGNDVVIAVLPETPPEGAEIAGHKIAERLETEATNVDARSAGSPTPRTTRRSGSSSSASRRSCVVTTRRPPPARDRTFAAVTDAS